MDTAGTVYQLQNVDISKSKNFEMGNPADANKFQKYREKIKSKEKMDYPELLFDENKEKYIVAEGNNRYSAHKSLRRKEMLAWVAVIEKGEYYPQRHCDLVLNAFKAGKNVPDSNLERYKVLIEKESKNRKIKLK